MWAHRTCGPPLPFVLSNQNTTDKAESLHNRTTFVVETMIGLWHMIIFIYSSSSSYLPMWRYLYFLTFLYIKHILGWQYSDKTFIHKGPLAKCLPSRNVPSMTEQECYLECFLQFSKQLIPFPFPPLFCSCSFVFLYWFKNTQDPGVIVFVQTSADFCFASGRVGSQERERQREKETTRQTERKKQSHPPKTVNWLRVWMLPSIQCPWVVVRSLPPLLCCLCQALCGFRL